MEEKVISDDGRQQYGITLCMQHVNEVVSGDFIGKGMVQEDGVAVLLSCDAFKYSTLNALAVCLELVGSMLLFSCPNQFP